MLIRLAIPLLVAAMFSCAAYAQENSTMLDLKNALSLALKENPQLGGARATADAAQTSVAQSKSALRPQVNVQTRYSYITEGTTFGTTPVLEENTWINRIELQQILYSSGRIPAQIDQALYGYQVALSGVKAVSADVMTIVSQAYFRVKQAKEGIAVAESSVAALEASYDSAKKLEEAGVVTRSDVLRTEVALTSAREELINARNNESIALAALKTAIGLPQEIDITISDKPTDAPLELADKIEPELRAEIAAAQAQLQAAQAVRRAANSGNKPSIALVADFENQPIGSEFPRQSNTAMISIVATLNVFDGGLTRARVNEADAQIRRAQENLNAVQNAVSLQQKTARLNLESAQARVKTTETQVLSAEETLRTQQIGYKEGITPLTDVLDAEAALTAARFSRLRALYDLRLAQVDFLRALGRTDVLLQ